MDSIQERIISARILMREGRYFDAFLLGLIAFAGVSRRRYPKSTSYKLYFEKKRVSHPAQQKQIANAERDREGAVRKAKGNAHLSDKEAFQCLVFDEIGKITGPNLKHPPAINVSFPYVPDLTPMNFEEILYRYFRCTSVHEGRFPDTVELTNPELVLHDGVWQLADVLKLQLPNGWPKTWIENLLNLVETCPEMKGPDATVAGESTTCGIRPARR